MAHLGLTPSERELRKLARDLRRDEDERRRIFEEEMRNFQTQREEYVRQVAQRRINVEEPEPLMTHQRSYESEPEEDLDYLLTLNTSGYGLRQVTPDVTEHRERNADSEVGTQSERDIRSQRAQEEDLRVRTQPVVHNRERTFQEPRTEYRGPSQLIKQLIRK